MCADSSQITAQYFLFLQQLYNFFAASTSRWNELMNIFKEAGQNIKTPKSLSTTRWSCRYDASAAVLNSYSSLVNCLEKLKDDESKDGLTRTEARSILKNLQRPTTHFMLIFWTKILERFNKVSKSLQKVQNTLNTVRTLLSSLREYFQTMRNDFEMIQEEVRTKFGVIENENPDQTRPQRLRKRKLHFDEVPGSEEVLMSENTKLKVEGFYAVIDNAIAELERRGKVYDEVFQRFEFLFCLDETKEVILEKMKIFQEFYRSEVSDDLFNEYLHFKHFILADNRDPQLVTPSEMLECIVQNKVESTFPNVFIALKLYLVLPISSATGERSFNVLKRIKNFLRTTLGDDKFSRLSLLCIENDLTQNFNNEDLLNEFAALKARKKFM